MICLKTGPKTLTFLTMLTLDGSLEEGLAGLAGGHTVMEARGRVPTHQAEPSGTLLLYLKHISTALAK
jgi:hypothetical protein